MGPETMIKVNFHKSSAEFIPNDDWCSKINIKSQNFTTTQDGHHQHEYVVTFEIDPYEEDSERRMDIRILNGHQHTGLYVELTGPSEVYHTTLISPMTDARMTNYLEYDPKVDVSKRKYEITRIEIEKDYDCEHVMYLYLNKTTIGQYYVDPESDDKHLITFNPYNMGATGTSDDMMDIGGGGGSGGGDYFYPSTSGGITCGGGFGGGGEGSTTTTTNTSTTTSDFGGGGGGGFGDDDFVYPSTSGITCSGGGGFGGFGGGFGDRGSTTSDFGGIPYGGDGGFGGGGRGEDYSPPPPATNDIKIHTDGDNVCHITIKYTNRRGTLKTGRIN